MDKLWQKLLNISIEDRSVDELMNVEREYLEALAHITSFSFYAGNLALNGQKEDGIAYSMLFSKKEKHTP